MLPGLRLLLDSFWRAAAYCVRPRVIALSLMPLLLMATAASGLAYFYWDAAVQGMRGLLDGYAVLATFWGWLQRWGLGMLLRSSHPSWSCWWLPRPWW